MPTRVEWTPPAKRDLEGIVRHIAEENLDAAFRIEDRIVAAVDRLARFPKLGRVGSRWEARELAIPRTSYLAFYRLVEDRVEVLRIVHGAQDWQSGDV